MLGRRLTARKASASKFLETREILLLLSKEHRLDAVEEAFEPTYELGVRNAQFRLRGSSFFERKAETMQLVTQLRR